MMSPLPSLSTHVIDAASGHANTVAISARAAGPVLRAAASIRGGRGHVVPFGPGWWAFSFRYAATVACALRWLSAEHPTGSQAWTWALLVLVTPAQHLLAVRIVAALARGRFQPPLAPPLTARRRRRSGG